MKKILFVHHSLGLGGAEMMRFILLKNMDRQRYIIKICCIGKMGILGERLEKMGYKVDELCENTHSFSPAITYKLAKYFKKEKPDIIHSSLFNANFHCRLAGLLCGIPHMITEEHGEHKQYVNIKFFPYILSDFILSNVSDFIISCSDRLKEDIIKKEKLPHNKVVSIENCLDLELCRIKTQREEIRSKYNIGEDETVFIITANLKKEKGHSYFIDALSEVKAAGYNFKCFFAGDGPHGEALCGKCRELNLNNEIIFLGVVDNAPDYLNASDVFVLPSFSEGLSVALMEAMAMGLACIVTGVGSNPDLIKTDFNGVVIRPGDKLQLKNAILFCLKNKILIKQFGERSKNVIKEKYSSVNKYKDKYYKIWDYHFADAS